MVSDQVNHYIGSLINARNNLLTEMEEFARTDNVPIMDIVSMEAMLQIVSLARSKKVLEVGTAIGYSAIRIAEKLPDCKIVSIERDKDRYEKARQFINRANLNDRITLIYGDALEIASELKKFGDFDCLFIDAAKGQYKRFFELYSPFLEKEGLVISDNVLFKGIVAEEGKVAKGLRTMVVNLRAYNEMLIANKEYETAFYPIGDGLAVSKKK